VSGELRWVGRQSQVRCSYECVASVVGGAALWLAGVDNEVRDCDSLAP
jgi:hypothetical protein